jgi:hypothetical protein
VYIGFVVGVGLLDENSLAARFRMKSSEGGTEKGICRSLCAWGQKKAMDCCLLFFRTGEFLSKTTQERGSGARRGFESGQVGWQRPALPPSRWLLRMDCCLLSTTEKIYVSSSIYMSVAINWKDLREFINLHVSSHHYYILFSFFTFFLPCFLIYSLIILFIFYCPNAHWVWSSTWVQFKSAQMV